MKVIISLVLLAAATVHAQNAQTRAQNYCAGLTALSADLDQLQALRPDANPAELRAIADRVDKDVRLIEQDIAQRDTPDARKFMASSEALLVKARAVPDGMTMDQAKARFQDDIQNVRQASSALQSSCGTAGSSAP